MNIKDLATVKELNQALSSIDDRIAHGQNREFIVETKSGNRRLIDPRNLDDVGFFNEQEEAIIALIVLNALQRKRNAVVSALKDLGVEVDQ